MSFRKHIEAKVIKTSYIVSFYHTTTAYSLKQYLDKVPDKATITDMTAIDVKDGDYEIWFEEEVEEE